MTKMEMAPEIQAIIDNPPKDMTSLDVKVGGVYFRLPKLADGRLLLFKCLPNCGNCCRNTDRLPLTYGDIERLAAKMDKTVEEFMDTECNPVELEKDAVNWAQQFKTKTRLITLKRSVDEKPENDGEHIPCRFLNKSEKCTIYPVRPLACRIFPFTNYGVGERGLTIGFMTGPESKICPGFYLSKNFKQMRGVMEEEAQVMQHFFKEWKESTQRGVFDVLSVEAVN